MTRHDTITSEVTKMKPEYETPKGPDDVVLEEMRQQVFKEVSQKHFDEWLAAASNPVSHWGTK